MGHHMIRSGWSDISDTMRCGFDKDSTFLTHRAKTTYTADLSIPVS